MCYALELCPTWAPAERDRSNQKGSIPMEGLKHLIDYGIIGLLIALSLWAVAVATER